MQRLKPWVAARNQAQPQRGVRNGNLFAIGIRLQVNCTASAADTPTNATSTPTATPILPTKIDFIAASHRPDRHPGTSSPSARRTHNPTSC
jgi:hypothetical protein